MKHLKLFEPTPKTPGKYVALSYCWGDGNGMKATRSNLIELLQEIDEDELPATVQDAVELVRYLGVQYLWVDALCIIQDDTQDWLHESAQMSTVYAQAFLTVSASSVASSGFSFLHQSRANSEVLFELPERPTSDRNQFNSTDNDPPTPPGMLAVRRTTASGFHQDRYDDIIDPVMLRAWTLQEHILSTRLVSFSTDELQWICRTLRACECGHPDTSESPRLEDLQQSMKGMRYSEEKFQLFECFRFWYRIVEAYCRRNLSCMRDKLPALSGVAYGFSQIFNELELATTTDLPPLRYLAGLWSVDIHKGLLWTTGGNTVSSYDYLEDYRAPTWSWASVEGTKHWSDLWVTPQAEILECVCALANPDDQFGQVVRQGTYLRVRATVLQTQMQIGRGRMCQTKYGRIFFDRRLEDVPLGSAVLGQPNAVAEAADAAEMLDPLPSKTVRRRRGKDQNNVIADKMHQKVSDDEGINDGPLHWEQANFGKQFTVWLIHVADMPNIEEGDVPQCLVLGKPLGNEEEFERVGLLRIDDMDKAPQFAGQAKSVITIV